MAGGRVVNDVKKMKTTTTGRDGVLQLYESAD
jgi:hypothetical protein